LKIHETTKQNIEKMTEKYRVAGSKGKKELKLETGDLVWLHLRKERFPDLRKSKLMPRADGPFKILEKINDNAYKLELPSEFGVSPTFNISNLKPYLGEEDALESRMTPIQEGEDDEDITPLDIQTIQAPITRARARQLNLEVSLLLSISINNCENGLLPNFYNVIRNQGEVQGTHGEEHGGLEEQQGPPSHMETQSNLTSSPPPSPGAA
jgi:hypothetical protein